MKNKFYCALLILIFVIGYSCKNENASNAPLPKYGEKTIVDGDTTFYKIPEFLFIDQDSTPISNESLSDYIYLTDFFFTSCPSICPIVKKQMLRIYDKYEDNPQVKLVSHTLDPKRDTAEKLKQYADKLNVSDDKWLFLTGDKDSLIDMSAKYFISAYEDDDAPGGIDHSGLVVLVDKKGHIRASAQGTDPDDMTDLLLDIDKLLQEYETTN
ncbi:SCO family protein [Saprospiraceae bacterium]|nr:SCO family protein [Saprospiraceae bacterium]